MRRNRAILCIMIALLGIAALASLCLGSSELTPGEVILSALRNEDTAAARIFRYVRLPRTIAAVLAGAALSSAGLLLQSVLRNPLAAPSVIGVNSGAGLCALICTAVFPSALHLAPLAAFLGALIAVFAVYLLARLTGASRSTILLAGVAVNSIFGACMDAIVTLLPDAALNRSVFSIGGFTGATMRQLGFAAPLIAIGLLVAILFHREMRILALGDDVARSLGLHTECFRALFLAAAAMMAGAAVSLSGLLGFVGLVAPHMTRLICRNDTQLQLPITACFGAAVCLICDLIARTLFAPYELPVGIVLSFVGAPFFLYLLLARKKRSRHSSV